MTKSITTYVHRNYINIFTFGSQFKYNIYTFIQSYECFKVCECILFWTTKLNNWKCAEKVQKRTSRSKFENKKLREIFVSSLDWPLECDSTKHLVVVLQLISWFSKRSPVFSGPFFCLSIKKTDLLTSHHENWQETIARAFGAPATLPGL